MTTPRFFTESEVRSHLPMPDLIDAMERALIEFSAGRVEQPVRTVLKFANASLFGLMPAYVPALPALGAKLVTVCAANAARGLDTHQPIIVMLNPETGIAEAILDGRYITEARTPPVSADSARHLTKKDPLILCDLNSAVYARRPYKSHLHATNSTNLHAYIPNPPPL